MSNSPESYHVETHQRPARLLQSGANVLLHWKCCPALGKRLANKMLAIKSNRALAWPRCYVGVMKSFRFLNSKIIH